MNYVGAGIDLEMRLGPAPDGAEPVVDDVEIGYALADECGVEPGAPVEHALGA